jgi:hypothetical protein
MIETLKEYPYGGKIEVYRMVDKSASDYDKIVACCDYFARQGAKTLIYPHFTETFTNRDYILIFASLIGTEYWGKCPDFTVNGVWYEHEGYDVSKDLTRWKKRASTFCKMMTRGIKQSDRLILEDCGVSCQYIRRNIYNRIHFSKPKQNITEVYLKTPEGLELLYKKEAG